MSNRQCGKLPASAEEKRIRRDHQRIRVQLPQFRKDPVEIAFAAGLQEMKLKVERAGRLACFRDDCLGIRIVRVGQQRNSVRRRQQLSQELETFRPDLDVQRRDAGDISGRTTEASDETYGHRIGAGFENDRNSRSRRLGRQRGAGASGRRQYVHAALHQFGGHNWQPILFSFGPTVLNGDVSTLAITDLLESSPKCRQPCGEALRRSGAQISDHRHLLLRARRERQRRGGGETGDKRAAPKLEHLPPPAIRRPSIAPAQDGAGGLRQAQVATKPWPSP